MNGRPSVGCAVFSLCWKAGGVQSEVDIPLVKVRFSFSWSVSHPTGGDDGLAGGGGEVGVPHHKVASGPLCMALKNPGLKVSSYLFGRLHLLVH